MTETIYSQSLPLSFFAITQKTVSLLVQVLGTDYEINDSPTS